MLRTVRLDKETERQLSRLVRCRGVSRSQVVRDAIAELSRRYVETDAESAYQAMKHLVGAVAGGPPDLSERTGKGLGQKLRERRGSRR